MGIEPTQPAWEPAFFAQNLPKIVNSVCSACVLRLFRPVLFRLSGLFNPVFSVRVYYGCIFFGCIRVYWKKPTVCLKSHYLSVQQEIYIIKHSESQTKFITYVFDQMNI